MSTIHGLCGSLLISVVAASAPLRSASACDVGDSAPFIVEANPSDETAPSTPEAAIVEIDRSHRPGCGAGACDYSSLRLRVSASDETSAGAEIGYEVHSDRLTVDHGPYRTDERGELFFVIDATDDGGLIDFEVELFAVDRAGNVSERSTTVRVRDRGGCAVGSAPGEGALWSVPVLAVLLYHSRRNARARRPSADRA